MKVTHNRRALLLGASTLAAAAFVPLKALAQPAAALPPAPTPGDWAKDPAISYVRLAPSGNKLCFIRTTNGTKVLCVNTVGGTDIETLNLGATEISGVDFLSDDRVLVLNQVWGTSVNRVRLTMGAIYDLKSKTAKTLFDGVDGFSGALHGRPQRVVMDGKTYIIAAARKSGDTDFTYYYKFDLDGQSSLYEQGPSDINSLIIAGDGRRIARDSYYNHNQHYLLEIFDGSWKTVFQGRFEMDPPQLVALDTDGKSVIVSKRDADKSWRYYRIGLNGTFSEPLPYTTDQASIVVDRHTRRMNGYMLTGDWGTYRFTDPVFAELAVKAQNAVADYRMNITDYADDPHKMIVYTEGDDDAGSYYFIDFTTGRSVTVGSEYPTVAPEWISSKKPITYKASDGLTIPAYLTLPPNRPAKSLPLIVLASFIPQRRADLANSSDVQTYADLGFAVLEPNSRGASGYSAAYTTAGYGEFGGKMQTDLSDGVAALVAQGLVDPQRVAIIGGGMGGLVALQAMAFQPGIYKCAVVFDEYGDLPSIISSGSVDVNIGQRELLRWLGGPQQVQKLALIPAASRVQGAILMFQNDSPNDYSRSGALAGALKGAGKDVTYYRRDWDITEAERVQTAVATADFLKQHLA